MQIAVDKLKWEIDVPFWSQQISFLCVGLIIVASIRGLLLQMAKVHQAGGARRDSPLVAVLGTLLDSPLVAVLETLF